MSKLTFRYGTIGSGKSMDLLKVNYNYGEHGFHTLILTSAIDTRYGKNLVRSRNGDDVYALSIDTDTDIFEMVLKYVGKINCILVDEVQFFNKEHIDQFIKVVDELNLPVICYGLRSDFKLQQFESTAYLMIVADEIEEIKTICSKCGTKKAIINARLLNGKITMTGDQIDIGGNDKYKPFCRKCFNLYK
jgi:thymidine kinase